MNDERFDYSTPIMHIQQEYQVNDIDFVPS